MNRTTDKNRVEEALEAILSDVRDGRLADAIAHHILYADPSAPSYTWSATNRLLMVHARTADARGYRQWQAVGRHVVRGAKAFYILAPRMVTVREADPETGEEKETKRCVGFLAVPVFRFEDTEGAPLPGYEPPPLPPLGQAVQTWGIRLEYGPSTRGEYGYLTAEGGRETIHLSSREPATLWHELGHAAHRRLLAAEGKALRGGQVPEQEIVAELVAATIARMQGEDPGKVAWCIRYMEAYAGSRARLVGEIARLADVAERCVRLIVEAAAQAAAA